MVAKEFLLERSQFVPHPREEVAAFFEDPRNLERITPPFLGFKILTKGEIEMTKGALIDYSIKLHGVPMKWRTLIEDYVPGQRFIDTQLSGPYTLWHHTHTFEDAPGGTLIGDRVRYIVPLGPLGQFARFLFVRRQLESIFAYRKKIVEELFPGSATAQKIPQPIAS